MSTIKGTVSNGITLGHAGYTSPLRITNTGTVSNSSGAAIYASGVYANPSITNQGSIIGTGDFDAIQLKDGATVANNGAGALIQGYTGIDISGAAGAVTNSGTINGTGTYGGGILLEEGGSVRNSGFIQGGPASVFYRYGNTYHTGGAVFIGGSPGTVSNSGTIVGTRLGVGGGGVYTFLAAGVYLGAGGSATNTGLIQGGVAISFTPFFGSGAGTVTNSGTIAGYVFLGAGGSVGNTGLIDGAAVFGSGAGTVTNSGTMGGAYLFGSGPGMVTNSGTMGGVELDGGGIVTNSGTILGGSRGILFVTGGLIQNTGLIQGNYGIQTFDAATVSNSGTIIGIGATRGGIDLEGSSLSSVSNTGLILGQDAGGVYISYQAFASGAGLVTNSGTIEGTGLSTYSNPQSHNGGVFLGAGGNVDNSGLIQGLGGVYIDHAAGTVTNSGTIAGTGLNGVILAAGGTVTDAGTITGGNGTAISFGGAGGNVLALENGYNLGGSVAVGGTGNTLELLGAAGAVTVDFDKSGAGFTNFDTIAFGASSNHMETLAITNAAVLPEKISGFTQLHDVVDLTQLAPKNATATLNASDQLVINNGSQSVSLQLDTSENYSGVIWLARPDGSGGTDVAVIQQGDPATQPNSVIVSAAAAGVTTDSPLGSQYKDGALHDFLLKTLSGSVPAVDLLPGSRMIGSPPWATLLHSQLGAGPGALTIPDTSMGWMPALHTG